MVKGPTQEISLVRQRPAESLWRTDTPLSPAFDVSCANICGSAGHHLPRSPNLFSQPFGRPLFSYRHVRGFTHRDRLMKPNANPEGRPSPGRPVSPLEPRQTRKTRFTKSSQIREILENHSAPSRALSSFSQRLVPGFDFSCTIRN